MAGTNPIYANFSVGDITKAKQFYVNKLGFVVKNEGQGTGFCKHDGLAALSMGVRFSY